MLLAYSIRAFISLPYTDAAKFVFFHYFSELHIDIVFLLVCPNRNNYLPFTSNNVGNKHYAFFRMGFRLQYQNRIVNYARQLLENIYGYFRMLIQYFLFFQEVFDHLSLYWRVYLPNLEVYLPHIS